MDTLGQSALVLGVISFALGFSALARSVRNKLFIAFAVLTTLLSFWSLAFFLERVWANGFFYPWHLFFNLWIAPAALGFIRVLVRSRDRFSRRLFELSLLSAMSLTVALALGYDDAVRYPWIRALMLYLPSLAVVQLLLLMWIDRRMRRGLKWVPKLPPRLPTVGLTRRTWIYLGGLVVLSISVMDHVPLLGPVVPALGNFGLAAYLFFVSQAITQQRLLNLSALFSRFLVLVVLSLFLSSVYWVLVGWIEDSPGLFAINSFIASFLLVTLLDPIRTLVRYFTERLLTPEQRSLERTLREAQRALTGVLDLSSIFQAVLLFVEQTLRPESAAVYVLSSDATKLRRVRWVGNQEPRTEIRELIANHVLLQHCANQKKRGELPILLDQMILSEIDRTTSRAQREQLTALVQGLRALGANMLIPVFDGEEILATVTLSVPNPPEPWGSNWGLLPILYPYFEQVAGAMRSMEIYARQKERDRLATLGQMAAGLAHEIRNPLGAIKGAAQYLDPSANRPEARFLKVIIEEVDRLNRVVTQFLDYSKAQAPELVEVDLKDIVTKTVEFLLPSLRGSTVHLVIDPRLESCVLRVSPEQIRQVLINLIQNSVRAVANHGTIRVGLDVGERDGVLWVEDDGMGIKREHLDKLFIPFFTTTPSGTGLGLSISQKIVEAHGGRIEVTSEEGRFTRFSVIIPRNP